MRRVALAALFFGRGGDAGTLVTRALSKRNPLRWSPKKSIPEIIEELEPVKRSVYCGSLGYISANGVMDTNIAIRTLVADNSTLHCWGGGGIVADSEADNEYDESLDKIRLLLDTLEKGS